MALKHFRKETYGVFRVLKKGDHVVPYFPFFSEETLDSLNATFVDYKNGWALNNSAATGDYPSKRPIYSSDEFIGPNMEPCILCAANKMELAGGDLIILGVRHGDPIMRSQIQYLKTHSDLPKDARTLIENQGFFGYDGKIVRWMSREEAKTIALANGQTTEELCSSPGSNKLYSECIY